MTEGGGVERGRHERVYRPLIGLLLLFLPLLAACGGSRAATTTLAPTHTPATTTADVAATSAVPAPAAGALRPVPIEQTLSGQDRVGAPGLGVLLFFDSEG